MGTGWNTKHGYLVCSPDTLHDSLSSTAYTAKSGCTPDPRGALGPGSHCRPHHCWRTPTYMPHVHKTGIPGVSLRCILCMAFITSVESEVGNPQSDHFSIFQGSKWVWETLAELCCAEIQEPDNKFRDPVKAPDAGPASCCYTAGISGGFLLAKLPPTPCMQSVPTTAPYT